MIVGYSKTEIERIIDDLRFTVKASKDVAEHYERSLQKRPEQTQWLEVIGQSKGRAKLAQQIADKLQKLIQD
jgi:hypothetical protein